MVAEGSVVLIWTLYFVTVSQNSDYFLFGASCLNAVTAITCFFIVESPRYLYGTQQFQRCEEVLEKIAKYNGYPEYTSPEFDVEYEIIDAVTTQDDNNDQKSRGTTVNEDEDAEATKNFNHLVVDDPNRGKTLVFDDPNRGKTTYNRTGQTFSRNTTRFTKTQNVAIMHEEQQNMR